MNEFIAKKLGEVLAFAEVGHETFEKGKAAFEIALGAERAGQSVKNNTTHAESIRKIGRDCGFNSTILGKLETTSKKLHAMRDLYVGDQWDNPTELLEWSGFFEGAATVHWGLVLGAAQVLVDNQKTLLHNDLFLLAMAGKEFHQSLLHEVDMTLQKIGGEKAKQEGPVES